MTDSLRVEMELFEQAVSQLSAADLVYQLEELTSILARGDAELGDYERQMLVRRVIVRQLRFNFNFKPYRVEEPQL